MASIDSISQSYKDSYFRTVNAGEDETMTVMSELVLLNKQKAIKSRYETEFASRVSFC